MTTPFRNMTYRITKKERKEDKRKVRSGDFLARVIVTYIVVFIGAFS